MFILVQYVLIYFLNFLLSTVYMVYKCVCVCVCVCVCQDKNEEEETACAITWGQKN